MTQDVLDILLQTEKEAADLIVRAEKEAVTLARETEQKILKQQAELKNEIKLQKQTLKTDLEKEYVKETAKAESAAAKKLEKLQIDKTALRSAAEYLTEKILA